MPMSLTGAQRRSANLLLSALRSEIQHELSSSSSSPSPPQLLGSLVEGFTVEADDPGAQDVLLRRRIEKEDEEIAVSALLGPLRSGDEGIGNGVDETLKRDVLMKVCVKKFGKDAVLHFHGVVPGRRQQQVEQLQSFSSAVKAILGNAGGGGGDGSHFAIRKAYYHPSMDYFGRYKFGGPKFSSLDPELQKAFKEYLIAKGITPKLTSFLVEHLYAKEQNQYLTWLRTVAGIVARHGNVSLPSDLH